MNPLFTRLMEQAEALRQTGAALQQQLPEGVRLAMTIHQDADFLPAVALSLHTDKASPAAIDWLKAQLPEAEESGPYGGGREGKQRDVQMQLSASLKLVAYQSGIKGRGKRK